MYGTSRIEIPRSMHSITSSGRVKIKINRKYVIKGFGENFQLTYHNASSRTAISRAFRNSGWISREQTLRSTMKDRWWSELSSLRADKSERKNKYEKELEEKKKYIFQHSRAGIQSRWLGCYCHAINNSNGVFDRRHSRASSRKISPRR